MFTREIHVMPSDASCLAAIKLRSLLDHFQNTAGLAVEGIEGTATELYERGYAWVLTRYEINFTGRLPVMDEKFCINTFHDPSHGYNMLRAFQVMSSDGKEIINAKSSWFLIDVKTGRPVKPVVHLPEVLLQDTGDINPDFQDIPDFDETQCIKTLEHRVTFHELDYNSHVNNAIYFGWIYDSTPVDLLNYEPEFIAASFRSGAKLGETVKILITEKDINTFAYKIMRENVVKAGANFVCKWRRILEEEE